MKLFVIASALLLVAGVAAAKDPDAAPAKDNAAKPAKNICLQKDRIDGWGARDEHTIVVNDVFGKKYLLSVAGWCQDLDFSLGLSFHSAGGGGFTCLDRGDYVVPHGGGTIPSPGARCMITKIEAYTPEMEKAYHEAKAAKKAKDEAGPAAADKPADTKQK
ncbi:MAG: DUF6491 family protein [Rhizomicrobium sp.]